MMNFYATLALLFRRCSLLRTAKTFLYGFVPALFLLIIVLAITGCSSIEIKHRPGRLPKIQVNTEYADDVELKLKDDGLIIQMEWEVSI